MEEKELFRDNNVYISDSRFVIGATTYAISNITSVSLEAHIPPKFTLLSSACMMLAGVCLYYGIHLESLIAIMLALPLIWFVALPFFSVPEYTVRIRNAGLEADALRSTDKAYILSVVEALNQAIIQRG